MYSKQFTHILLKKKNLDKNLSSSIKYYMEIYYKDDNAKNQRFYGQQLLSILTFLIIITNDNQTKILLNQMLCVLKLLLYTRKLSYKHFTPAF